AQGGQHAVLGGVHGRLHRALTAVMPMYPVSQAFQDAVLADRRRIVARAVIDYTNPQIDQSIQITASEQNRVSYPTQTADAVDQVPYRWAALDGTWVLDTEQWHLAPSPEEAK